MSVGILFKFHFIIIHSFNCVTIGEMLDITVYYSFRAAL